MTAPDRPRLTVAIPTFNGSSLIEFALRGVLDQANINIDLLICDDRSEDDTIAIARRIAGDRARIVVNENRLGLGANWNRCVELCETPLIAIFHQDDVMLPGHLAAHLDRFARDENQTLAMVASASIVIDDRGQSVPERVSPPGRLGERNQTFPRGEFPRSLVASNPVRCSGTTIRKSAHIQIGGFNVNLKYVIDWEYWIRLGSAFEVAWLAEPTVAIRRHRASESSRLARGIADLDEIEALYQNIKQSAPDDWKDDLARAQKNLADAYYKRIHELIIMDRFDLAKLCVKRSLGRSFRAWRAPARDPRSAVEIAALYAAPGWLKRRLRERDAEGLESRPS